jgi:hypothetical protein
MQIAAGNCARARVALWVGGLIGLACLSAALVSCGGGTNAVSSSGTGTINVTLTDPPSCAFPNGAFDHVYVTIRSVQANINATADDNSSGWQELAPQLNTQPKQIDLFSAASNTCLLTALGSNKALPAGTYQQIRLLLVANDGGGGPLPPSNACAGQGFNCVFLHGVNTPVELQLSSQANTGLKIPPGQIVGGPITVAAGKDVDLNIDFNACASIIQQGNGPFRLKPTLTAGQVSTNTTGISGQVVDQETLQAIPQGTNGAVLVALEQQDSTGTDVIFEEAVADANGNFNFCPLPSGATFDVVAVAINGAGVAYNATVAVGVPGGTNLGKMPLAPETGATGPTTFRGFVTAKAGPAPATIDASVGAMQTVPIGNNLTRDVTIPAESTAFLTSTANLSVSSNALCPAGAPPNSNCAEYTLIEPASNPRVGLFSGGTIASYSIPALPPVPYQIRATAAAPLSGGAAICAPSFAISNQDSGGNPLKALAGATVLVKNIDLSGCS